MHEFSICRGLIQQVEAIAHEHGAHRVCSISLRIGPLAGVDISLLRHAFPIASTTSIVNGARLQIECPAPRIRCLECANECEVSCNHLICNRCNSQRAELIQGNELLLIDVELELEKNDV